MREAAAEEAQDPATRLQPDRRRLPPDARVTATPVLGGLHRDDRFDRAA